MKKKNRQVARLEQDISHQLQLLRQHEHDVFFTNSEPALVERVRECVEDFGECSLAELENLQTSKSYNAYMHIPATRACYAKNDFPNLAPCLQVYTKWLNQSPAYLKATLRKKSGWKMDYHYKYDY